MHVPESHLKRWHNIIKYKVRAWAWVWQVFEFCRWRGVTILCIISLHRVWCSSFLLLTSEQCVQSSSTNFTHSGLKFFSEFFFTLLFWHICQMRIFLSVLNLQWKLLCPQVFYMTPWKFTLISSLHCWRI